jgi:hypothetical protein
MSIHEIPAPPISDIAQFPVIDYSRAVVPLEWYEDVKNWAYMKGRQDAAEAWLAFVNDESHTFFEEEEMIQILRGSATTVSQCVSEPGL